MIECALCKRAVDARSTHRCGVCSAVLCDDCSNESSGTCPECGAGEEDYRGE